MTKLVKSVDKYAQRARKAGKLIPTLLCERCGIVPPVLAHHTDYSKPLQVIWLCHKCHKAVHPGNNQIKGKPHFNFKRCRVCNSYYEGLLQPCPSCALKRQKENLPHKKPDLAKALKYAIQNENGTDTLVER